MRSLSAPLTRLLITSCVLAGLGGLSGCATPPTSSVAQPGQPRWANGWNGSVSHPQAATRQHIIRAAERLLGTPYRLGGESPSGVDCSGLVQYAYLQVGIQVPRSAAAQFQAGWNQRQVLPGDLLFFRTSGGQRISHVGIYVGGGQMIHASSGSRRVRKVSLNHPYWRRHMAGGVTFIGRPPSTVTGSGRTIGPPRG